ncbi:subtilisin-protease-like protein [Medicago truncatula]|uniref:Subtilisin-protease-like protein n=1 Tax=Medicago truncatula TaxID=3880 RepID=A0A072U3M3_MEDTR|nr:subtilisin-protease-like protein [Medicago truncatula]
MDNGQVLYGESMYLVNIIASNGKELEPVYLSGGDSESQFASILSSKGVNGRSEKGQVVNEASSTAMILANTELNLEEDSIDVHVLPATLVGFDESIPLKSYINSTTRPLSQIEFGETIIGKSIAPALARFSVRGKKPWSDKPSREHQKTDFSIMFDTSMTCPHVSGIAAGTRSARPRLKI